MNALTLTGYLTEDPELGFAGEKPVCKLRLAVDNGRHPTTYIDVRAFGEHAFACAEYLRKGRRVGVSGRLAFDEWKNAAGERRQRYSVIGRVEFLDRPPREEEPDSPESAEPGGTGTAEPELALAA